MAICAFDKALRKNYMKKSIICALAILVFGVSLGQAPASAAPTHKTETATLAAGCFWSMEAIYKQLKGVISVMPGYAGGKKANPSYEDVETGTTGYAESVNITFDPTVIPYIELIRVLLIARNPTTVNQQGNDAGTQYRSVIFYRTPQQQKQAMDVIEQVNLQHVWDSPIVTKVEPFSTFYRAEDYHINYYALHPDEPYCAYVIAPEIANFRQKFKADLKS